MEIVRVEIGQDLARGFPQNPAQGSALARRGESDLLPSVDETVVKKNAGDNESALKNAQVNSQLADKEDSERQQRDVETAAREIEAFLQVQARNLSFSVDQETQRSVVTVKDSESGDVIRQIPSAEVLRLAERIKELQEDVGSSVGVLLNSRV